MGGTIKGGTIEGGTAGEWLWAWTISAFLLPVALMIGARLMNMPIPKELELATLILGALLFLASGSWVIDNMPRRIDVNDITMELSRDLSPIDPFSLMLRGNKKKDNFNEALGAMCIITSFSMIADAVIVAMTFLRQG